MQTCAAIALGRLGTDAAFEALQAAWHAGPIDRDLRATLVDAIGSFDRPEARDLLRNGFASAVDPNERLLMVDALASRGAPEFLATLHHAVTAEREPCVKYEEIRAIGAYGDPASAPILRGVFASEVDATAKLRALESLRTLGPEHLLAFADEAFATEPQPDMQAELLKLVAEIESPESAAFLERTRAATRVDALRSLADALFAGERPCR